MCMWLFERVRLSIPDGSKSKRLDAKPRKDNLTCTVIQMTFGASPNHSPPPASKYMLSETVIGLMLDVEQTLCPHHEVKLTFMKLKSRVGFLCWYGFMRHYCSALHISCALKVTPPPTPHTTQEEWNAWKQHYCALTTWPTVNGWVKVPSEMHDIT